MQNIRLALLGMGRIGKIHFSHIGQHFTNATIIAVADTQLDSNAFERDYRNVEFSSNPFEVIERDDVDAVIICTPTSSHAELLEKAIQNGKHIFCEKPMDLSLEKSVSLAEMADEAGVKLMLGFNRRFDPNFLHAYNSVRDGKVGNVQIIKITSRDPGLPSIDYIKSSGGLFMDMAIHDFDMARYIMGKEVVEVLAKGMVLVDPAVAKAGDIDTALTVLTFEDGSCAVIDNSRRAVYGYDQRLEIFGDGGMIKVENNLHNQNILFDKDGIHHALPLDFFMDRYTTSYLKEMQVFIEALYKDEAVPVGGFDGLQATRIAYAAKLSMEEERSVQLTEVDIRSRLTV